MKICWFCAIRTNRENVQKLYFGNILAWFLADRHEKFMQNSLHSFFNIHRNVRNHIAFYGILTHSLELDLAIFWMTTTTTTTSMTMTTEMMMTMAASFHLLPIRWLVSGEKECSLISCKCWRIKFKRFSFVPLSKSCQCPYMQIHTETFIRICWRVYGFSGRMNERHEWRSRPKKRANKEIEPRTKTIKKEKTFALSETFCWHFIFEKETLNWLV